MTLWLVRLLSVRLLRGWRVYLLILLAAFGLAWILMAVFEPAGADIARPENYWWWFFVTAFTVGYGDLFPVSAGGRAAALLVMIATIGVVAALVGDLLEWTAARRSKRAKGLAPVQARDHFVLVGYAAGRTERLVSELCAEPGSEVVICATMGQVGEHPMPDEHRVSLVRGDVTDNAVLGRASLGAARAAIVDDPDGDDDRAALVALVASRLAPGLHIVVAARDLDRMVRLLRQFGSNFECAEWYDVRMLSEAANDPGITHFHADLKTSGTGSDTHSLRLPETVDGRTLGDLHYPLKERLNVTVCALGTDERFINNPPLSTPLEGGMILYYIGDQRLAWKDVQAALGKPPGRGRAATR